MENFIIIPVKDRKYLRDQVIRRLYNKGNGRTMDEIVQISKQNPELFYSSSGLSKSTVFFAINGRPKKKVIKQQP